MQETKELKKNVLVDIINIMEGDLDDYNYLKGQLEIAGYKIEAGNENLLDIAYNKIKNLGQENNINNIIINDVINSFHEAITYSLKQKDAIIDNYKKDYEEQQKEIERLRDMLREQAY